MLCVIFSLAAVPLFPQNSGSLPETEAAQAAEANLPDAAAPEDAPLAEEDSPLDALPEDAVFVINRITFNVKGITTRNALINNGEFAEGETIKGKERFKKYIKDKTQTLVNQRVLKDNVSIEYTLGEAREDGSFPADLVIHVEDSWNIIVLPKPNIDRNSGFKLTLNARDYNFLGTMNPLRVDIGYEYDENKHSSFLIDIDSDTPFRAFGFNWNINFDHSFSYRPDVEEPFFYKNVTGLSMELPVKKTTVTFGFDESLILNEENANRYKKEYWPASPYDNFQKGLYMSSKLYTKWEIPTSLQISEYGELTYTPSISFTFNHELPRWELADFRKGNSMAFGHTLGFNRINWIGNYRSGMDVSMGNSYGYNFHQIDEDGKALSISYTLKGIGHFIITDYFGISTRLMFRHWFYHNPDYYESAGDALRGIVDKDIHANLMLSLNLDFPFRVLQFTPSKWLNRPKARVFDFEMHLSPFVDMALYRGEDNTIGKKNIQAAGGLELFVFPSFFRAVYLRASFGWDLKEVLKDPSAENFKNFEYFIGLGHSY